MSIKDIKASRRPVDEAAKVFFGQPDAAADLFTLCFSKYTKRHGRILPQHLIRLDPAHYNVVFKEKGVYKSDNSHRDLLFKCQLPSSPGNFIYIGVELQTRYDRTMLERCGRYDLQFYIEQKNDIAGRGSKELVPIINIVLNLSCTPWRDGNILIPTPRRWPNELMALYPNYFINIFDITKLAEKSSQVACDELRTVLNCYRYRNNKRKLRNILSKGIHDGILSVYAAILINLCLRLKLKLRKNKEKIDMCKAWEEYTRDCEKRGEKRGIKIGVKIGEENKEKFCIGVVIAMLSERLPISSIVRVTGKSLASIRKIAKENALTIY
ncbi:MAG: Rpn family recombination-promoting nuclease/putative transposase [Victivallales bacterium]|nr:Rpn family recombination-promoting nuclease/putative transposase [Victivallales bacterium]